MVQHSPARASFSAAALVAAALGALIVEPVATALAGPPPWAPAHGYRAKQRPAPPPVVVAPAPPPRIQLAQCNRELIGAALGGAAGGYLGYELGGKGTQRAVATVGGAVLGVLIGGAVGRAMDEADQRCVGHVLESVPSGHTVAWQEPGGPHYEVTPQRTFEPAPGRYCREYTATATIGGRPETVYGTACRQPDGSWERVGS